MVLESNTMKTLTVVIYFLIFYLKVSHQALLQDDEDELVAVAVLYREGDKTPSSSFPNDPYIASSYWPMGYNQLTEQGKTRQYELGEWFRDRYSTFLPEIYNPKDIYVLSTDTDRTLMSAQANLAGLYPPKGSQVWNKNLLWQPIPVHTVPKKEDQILYMERPCAKYNQLYGEVSTNEFFQSINVAYADFYKEVSNLTGWDIDDVYYFSTLQAILYVYEQMDPDYLPSWYEDLDKTNLEFLAGLDYARYTFTDDLKRLGDGPFFNNLLSGFDKVLDGDEDAPKFLMLSGHVSTLASVLNGMDVFDGKAPEFASCVIWEVKKSSDGYYVNLFYKRTSEDVVDQLKLPGCDSNCKYEEFKAILGAFAMDLDAWDVECQESN